MLPTSRTLPRLLTYLRKEWGLLLALLFLILFPFIFGVFSGTSATAGPARFWQGLLINFFIMAVYAMSYDLLMGYIGILTFGQAAFFGSGAYAMGLFLKHSAPVIGSAYRVSFPGLGDITDFILLGIGFILAVLASGLMGLFFSFLSIRVKGVYFTMITLAAAGLAGSWYALWNLSVSPNTATSTLVTINALIMTILGGMGTLIGPVLGAGLMQVIGQYFDQWFGPRWPLVFGLVFIALVMFLPYGIVGTWRLKKANLKEGWQKFLALLKK
jgi:ABC-type branched-subunit amino acid transport system permease subunit